MSQSTGIETNGVEQIPDDQRDASRWTCSA